MSSVTSICAGSCPLVLRLRQLAPTWALPVLHSPRRLAWCPARAAAVPLVPLVLLVLLGACRPLHRPRSAPAPVLRSADIPGDLPALVMLLPPLPATAIGTSAGSRLIKRPATTGMEDAGLP